MFGIRVRVGVMSNSTISATRSIKLPNRSLGLSRGMHSLQATSGLFSMAMERLLDAD